MEVFAVHQSPTGHARIVVGVDGSEHARRALQWAVDEARLRGARVEAVHAWHYPYLPTPPYERPRVRGADEIEKAARTKLERVVASVDANGLVAPIEPILVWDSNPANALLDAAKGADMLVVGSRGRGGFSGLLLGSVSQEVAPHAKCAVVIVRAGERSAPEREER
jgi:nucleotide-binding universal stress UspA family protein